MNKETLIKAAADFVLSSRDNYVQREAAISEAVVGMQIFAEPIWGFAAADDLIFPEFKKTGVIGSHFLLPTEWLPQAKTVISFFLPFTEAVKKGNMTDAKWPSPEWLHGRIEGQVFINQLCSFIKKTLLEAGYNSLVPSMEANFWSNTAANGQMPFPDVSFSSNWSERHIAYAAGLGTFGLSKGLITAKGMAGRLGSIVTKLELSPTPRGYTDPYEFCSRCGACVRKCPVQAISLATGKDHTACSQFLNQTMEKYSPRYGCGKCQTGVPCESKIPGR